MTAAGPTAPPGWFRISNRVVVGLHRIGLPPGNIHLLTIAGRRTGRPRTTPVTPFTVAGRRYVLGGYPGADWIRNARAAGRGELGRGRRAEPVRLVELPADQARVVLRAFPAQVPHGVTSLRKTGLVRAGTPDEFADLAGRCPVFRLDPID